MPPEALKAALVSISVWQQMPSRPAECPLCNAATLAIEDRSARPYTAWFALSCSNCGLADTITYPMGGTGNSWS